MSPSFNKRGYLAWLSNAIAEDYDILSKGGADLRMWDDYRAGIISGDELDNLNVLIWSEDTESWKLGAEIIKQKEQSFLKTYPYVQDEKDQNVP